MIVLLCVQCNKIFSIEYDEYAESKDALRYTELPTKISQVKSKKLEKTDEEIQRQRQEFKFRKELNVRIKITSIY